MYVLIAVVVAYLSAAVIANTAVTWFGQTALVVTAFVLIPLDLLARDILHRHLAWYGPLATVVGMAVLIAAGSGLSLVSASPEVAVASMVAFAAAGSADALVYGWLSERSTEDRMLYSNLVSAVVDSVVFPLVAFGAIEWWLSGSQAILKVLGTVVLLTPMATLARRF